MKKYLFVILISVPALLAAQNKPKLKKVRTPNTCGPVKETNPTIIMNNKLLNRGNNVLGTPLQIAGTDPITGYYRDGYCTAGAADRGVHVVAAIVTDQFLAYSKSQGNDLITPAPNYGFKGLKSGDKWCLCASRWKEAYTAGVAPPVLLEATHEKALAFATLEELMSVKR